MKTFKTMLKTELKLSLRGMDMFIFAIGLPLVMVILLGIIYEQNPAFEGAEYTFLEQSFGAISTISICAGGVMGLPLLISDYRHKKILKRFQTTPISPVVILAVHLVIYSLYAVISLVLIYAVGNLFFGLHIRGSILQFLLCYLLVMFSMFSLGTVVGGLAPDIKTAGILASVLYFPMLIFSGATLPYEIMPPVLQKLSDGLVLTQGIKLLKAAFLNQPVESVIFPIILMLAIMTGCMILTIRFFKWE